MTRSLLLHLRGFLTPRKGLSSKPYWVYTTLGIFRPYFLWGRGGGGVYGHNRWYSVYFQGTYNLVVYFPILGSVLWKEGVSFHKFRGQEEIISSGESAQRQAPFLAQLLTRSHVLQRPTRANTQCLVNGLLQHLTRAEGLVTWHQSIPPYSNLWKTAWW